MARRHSPGTIIRIDLGDGNHTYGRELRHPFLAVYDARSTEPMAPEEIIVRPPLFVVAVFDEAFNRWTKIEHVPLRLDELPIPDRFNQDRIDVADCRIIDAEGNERPATIEECEGLEAAVIWDSDEIEDRVRDHYAGKPNKLMRSLRLKRPNGDQD